MATVTVPSIRYTGLYYSQLVRTLRQFGRDNYPEISDEDPNEPLIQLERADALMGHYMAALLDHVAQECFLATARLRESVKGHLALIDVKVKQETPSTATLLAQLPQPLTVATSLPKLALFATAATDTVAAISFETQATVALDASSVPSYVYDSNGGTFTDQTANASTDADTFQLHGGVPNAGDALYIGHKSVLWGKLALKYTVLGDTAYWGTNTALEVYDGQTDDTNPTAITNPAGTTLRFDCTSLLGALQRTGAIVTVTSLQSGVKVDKTSAWTGAFNYVEATAEELGITVNTVVTSFFIGAVWKEVGSVVRTEDTSAKTETYTYTLPETIARKWTKANLKTVLGGTAPSVSAHWMRLRVVITSTTAPTLDRVRIDQGAQFFTFSATQGETVSDLTFGVSTGVASQVFFGDKVNAIEASEKVTIDEGAGQVTWSRVDSFLASQATDRHYTVKYDADGVLGVGFGDGINGKIPLNASVIQVVYRVGAVDNGNVGAQTITTNRSGVALVSSITNPRAATGWKAADGGTTEALEKLKISGPAELRAQKRVMSDLDIEVVATTWVASDGSIPFARSKSFDEASGPKTVEILVVERGTAPVAQSVLDAFKLYLNGDPVTGAQGVLLLNTEATVNRYTARAINVVATVKGGDANVIKAALLLFLAPTAVEGDGTYVFSIGGTVYKERIVAEIFEADPAVKNVSALTLNGGGDVVMTSRELPVAGTITITVTA